MRGTHELKGVVFQDPEVRPAVRSAASSWSWSPSGLFAIISVSALALDVSHAMVNKTRLQNAVDAAALSAAKALDQSGSTDQARDAATAVFPEQTPRAVATGSWASSSGAAARSGSSSRTRSNPFSSGTTPAQYVRGRSRQFSTGDLDRGRDRHHGKERRSDGSVRSQPPFGAGDEVCNLAPVMVCGDPTDPPDTHFGYVLDAVQVLKTSTTNGEWDVGPGNFQLIRLDGGQGGADVREGLAGGYDACASGDEPIQTEPGIPSVR
jgi:hypothetical protein